MNSIPARPAYTSPRQAISTMFSVVMALMLRETQTRYGRLRLGYVWALIEPMLFVLVLTIIFTYRRRFAPHGIPPVLFFLSGIMPFMLFRDQVSQAMNAIRPNRNLLAFPQVQIFDLTAARSILEFATNLLALTILVGAIWLLEVVPINIQDLLGMLLSVCLLGLLGFGLGTLLSAIIPIFPVLQYLVQMILLRPLFFLSGVFFTVEMLPPQLREIALYNPILQLIELFRASFFREYHSNYVDMPYICAWIILVVFFGMLTQRALRRYAIRR